MRTDAHRGLARSANTDGDAAQDPTWLERWADALEIVRRPARSNAENFQSVVVPHVGDHDATMRGRAARGNCP